MGFTRPRPAAPKKTRLEILLKEVQTVIYGRVSELGRDIVLKKVEILLKKLVADEKEQKEKRDEPRT